MWDWVALLNLNYFDRAYRTPIGLEIRWVFIDLCLEGLLFNLKRNRESVCAFNLWDDGNCLGIEYNIGGEAKRLQRIITRGAFVHGKWHLDGLLGRYVVLHEEKTPLTTQQGPNRAVEGLQKGGIEGKKVWNSREFSRKQEIWNASFSWARR